MRRTTARWGVPRSPARVAIRRYFSSLVWWSGAGLAATGLGGGLVIAPTVTVGLAFLMVLGGISYWRPQLGVGIWLLVTIFSPAWIEVHLEGRIFYPSYVAVPIVLAILLSGRRFVSGLSLVDLVVFTAGLLVWAEHGLFHQAGFLLVNVLVLLTSYVVGRLATPSSIGRVYAYAMLAVAVWGVTEFVFGMHLFTHIPPAQGTGPALQERAGFVRSEASLGHAIAYGACLAAAIPFVQRLRYPVAAQILLFFGVLVALSRGPMVAIILTFGLLVYVSGSITGGFGKRIVLLGGGGAAAYAIVGFLYADSAQELGSSSMARHTQAGQLLSLTNWFGPADGLHLVEGRYTANGIGIVDSAPLRLALDFGWLACLLLLWPAVVVLVRVASRRGGDATVALAGQVPVLLVTSFITQWQAIWFFLAGLAVSEIRHAARTVRGTDPGVPVAARDPQWVGTARRPRQEA